MTANFEIKVISLAPPFVRLRLFIINAEQHVFYDSAQFMLKVLWEAASHHGLKDSPLYQKITMKDIFNEDWLEDHADDMIEKVSPLEVRNYPLAEEVFQLSPNNYRKFWNKRTLLPQADFELKVADDQWIAHLGKSMAWQTAAVDPLVLNVPPFGS